MSASNKFNPTLLVGLGGRGSAIVDMIYKMIPAEQRSTVKTHVFDTNVNDLKELGLSKDDQTQTSTGDLVGSYLQNGLRANEPWQPHFPWFPQNPQPELMTRTLTDGAGQVRFLSRLAFRAAIEAGKMSSLRDKIRSLYEASGTSYETKPRVFIVATIAGGTGSGIFVQVALLLRKYFQELLQDKGKGVLIKGAFVLPDILIDTKVIADSRQHANIRANAYAALKELDAITRMSRGTEFRGYRNIELEYCPGQRNDQGESSSVLPLHMFPYNFSFLFESSTCKGGTYLDSAIYERQVARVVHTQLFSPIAANTYSEEDNQVLALIGAAGENRYCGAGVASIEYPYSSLLDYGATRWVADQLSDKWLQIDREYKLEVLQHERDEAAGIKRGAIPDKGEHYLALFKQLGKNDDNRFFSEIYETLFEELPEGKRGGSKAEGFVEAVQLFLAGEGDSNLREAEEASKLWDEGALVGKRDDAAKEVHRVENRLGDLQRKTEFFIDEQWRSYERDITLRDAQNAPQLRSDLRHRINTWLLDDGPGALHPLAARAFLYASRQIIDERQKEAEHAARKALTAIDRANGEFDLAETEAIKEDALGNLSAALAQPLYKRIFGDKFTEFGDLYIENTTRRRADLIRYRKAKLVSQVYQSLSAHIGKLLKFWETLFAQLEDVTRDMKARVEAMADAHDRSKDPTTRYVLAARSMKEALWDDIRPALGLKGMPPGVNRRLAEAIYLQFASIEIAGGVAKANGDNLRLAESELDEGCVAWCRNKLHDEALLDFDVIKALRKEAALSQKDTASFIKSAVDEADRLAQPLIPKATDHPLQKWGLNDRVAGSIPPADASAWFGESKGVVANSGFSPYVITRYRAYYGLSSSDFVKFKAPNGRYFAAYRDRIKDLTSGAGRTVTPHLDARWHASAYMPDLNKEEAERDRTAIRKAFVLGQIYGLIRRLKEDGQALWCFTRADGRTESIKVGNKPVDGRSAYALFQALAFDPGVYDQACEQAAVLERADYDIRPEVVESDGTIAQHAFCQGALQTNLIEGILSMAEHDRGTTNVGGATLELLQEFFLTILEHYSKSFGYGKENSAKTNATKFARRLISESGTWSGADKDSRALADWTSMFRTVFDDEPLCATIETTCETPRSLSI
jgi:hypothetical protein